MDSFYDVERGLRLIDVPGMEPEMLLPELALGLKPDLPQSFVKFVDDPIVREVTGTQTEEDTVLLRGLDMQNLYAYIIVYNQNISSRRMADALREAIRHSDRSIWVYMVENAGDFEPTEADKIWERWSHKKKRRGMLFSDKETLQTEVDDEFMKRNTVSASTFGGLEQLFNQIALDADSDALTNRRKLRRGAGGARGCDTSNCVVS